MIHNLARRLLPRTFRNWLRSPARSAEYILQRLSFMAGTRYQVSPMDGWELSCHPAARSSFEVFRKDPLQAEELQAFTSRCTARMKLLDVGAHYGLFALACRQFAGSDAQVLCVEASPKAASILRANLAMNDAGHQVTVVNCAIGDADGMLEMLATGPLGEDYFVSVSEARSDTISVPQLTLASLVAQTGFEPSHIKMDIESFEYEALGASQELLARIRPVLFLEIHGGMLVRRGKDPARIAEMLWDAGYTIWDAEDKPLDKAGLEALNYDCRVTARANVGA
jgi:FkbM family methyltransferase